MFNYGVFLVLLAFAADAKKDKTDHRPAFLQNVTKAGKEQFQAIIKNQYLTINEQEQKLQAWATDNKVLDEFNAFEKNRTATEDEIRKNITTVIGKLEEAKKLVDVVLTDKSLTKKQQRDKIDEIKEKYLVEVNTLFHIGRELKKASKGGKFRKGGGHHHRKLHDDKKNSSEDEEEDENDK